NAGTAGSPETARLCQRRESREWRVDCETEVVSIQPSAHSKTRGFRNHRISAQKRIRNFRWRDPGCFQNVCQPESAPEDFGRTSQANRHETPSVVLHQLAGLTRQTVVEGRDKGIAWNKVVIVLRPLGEHLLLLELVQCFAMLDPTLYHRSC